MSKKVEKKIVNPWTEEDMQKALHHLASVPNAGTRKTAREFGVRESTLRWRINNGDRELGKSGRKTVYSEGEERQLAECIAVVCNAGFSPTINEIQVSWSWERYLFILRGLIFAFFANFGHLAKFSPREIFKITILAKNPRKKKEIR